MCGFIFNFVVATFNLISTSMFLVFSSLDMFNLVNLSQFTSIILVKDNPLLVYYLHPSSDTSKLAMSMLKLIYKGKL